MDGFKVNKKVKPQFVFEGRSHYDCIHSTPYRDREETWKIEKWKKHFFSLKQCILNVSLCSFCLCARTYVQYVESGNVVQNTGGGLLWYNWHFGISFSSQSPSLANTKSTGQIDGQRTGEGKREEERRRDGEEERRGKGGRGEERKGIGNTCSGLTAGLPPPLPHPDNRTQQRRELGQNWCEAECEGDDTWVRVELGKMATSKC